MFISEDPQINKKKSNFQVAFSLFGKINKER